MVVVLSAVVQGATQRPIVTSILAIVAATILRVVQRGYRNRKFFRDLPGPPHSWIWGHLPIMGEVSKMVLPGVYPHHLLTEIAYKYDLPAVYYLDLWPVADNMVLIRDPDLADRIQLTKGIHQHKTAAEFLDPYFGENVIAVANGPIWKSLHSSFAPGLSWSSVRNLTGVIFSECAIFRERLSERATSGETFSLESLAGKMLFDTGGLTIFNERLKSQTVGTPLLRDMTAIMDHLEGHTDLANRMNPVRKLKLMWELPRLKSNIDKAVRRRIQSRLEELLDRDQLPSRANPDSVLDSFLRVHIQKDMEDNGQLRQTRKLPEAEMQLIVANAQGLLAGASGTTRDTFCYIAMLLSKAPDVREKIRSEIGSVLGKSFDVISNTAIENPEQLQQLPYTEAVIFESLRMFPNSLISKGAKDPNQTLDWNGGEYPIGNNLMIVEALTDMGYNEKYFSDPLEFRPERWLDEKNKLPKSYVRAFGRPPRACMGKNLGINELLILIASTIFDFEFECQNMKPNATQRMSHTNLDTVYGDLVFQKLGISAKPPEGMMVKVKNRTQ